MEIVCIWFSLLGLGDEITLRTVDTWPKVQGLGRRLSLDTVDVWSQVCDLGGDNHGDCGCATPGIGFRRWGYPGDCGHIPQVMGWGLKLPRRLCSCDPRWLVWREGSPRRLWTWYHRYRFWEAVTLQNVDLWIKVLGLVGGHIGNCGYVNPGTSSGEMTSPCRLWMWDPR